MANKVKTYVVAHDLHFPEYCKKTWAAMMELSKMSNQRVLSSAEINSITKKFLTIQKENLFIVSELRSNGTLPDSHARYLNLLSRALRTLNGLGSLEITTDSSTTSSKNNQN